MREETRPSQKSVKVLDRCTVSPVLRPLKSRGRYWAIWDVVQECSMFTPTCDFFSKCWRKGQCPSEGRM